MNKNYQSAEGKQGRTIIARIKPGQEIVSTLAEIVKQHDIRAGYIPTLFGGFKEAKIGSMKSSDDPNHPIDIEIEYTDPIDYHGTGTIAWQDSEPSLHIHLSAAGGELKGTTGHLVSGRVVFVTEVVIVELVNVTMARKPDPEVFDLPLLEVGNE